MVPEPGSGAEPVMSVILITRNGAATIDAQLDAVLDQRWDRPWELVVVDNESTDDTAEVVHRRMVDRPFVRLVESRGVTNVAAARNSGVAAARGRFVTVIDDDDQVGEGWLAALGDAVMRHDYVAARFDVSTINDETVRWARRTPAQTSRIDDWYGVPVASGPTIAVRRDWFLEVGGNDERLAAAEDIDFCIRLFQRYGVAPTFVPDAVYHYRLKSDARSSFRQGRHYGKIDPELYRRYRSVLTDVPSRRAALVEWARLGLTAPLCVVDRSRRLRWSYRTGIRVGRLIGSWRSRVFFP